MLYHLLIPLADQYIVFNLIRYQTFRSGLAFFVAFVLVLFLQPRFISKVRAYGGQPIRDDGPKDHFSKAGTPTMGGIVPILAILASSLLFCDLKNIYVWLTIAVMLAYAVLGFIDDWRKIAKQNSKGISGKTKLFWQILIATIVAVILLSSGFSSTLHVPFFKEIAIDLGLLFLVLMLLVLVGTSNAVNLTDGLDGLAIVPIMTVASTYGLFAYLAGHKTLSEYLGIFFVPGAGEVAILLAALVGAGLGFLWFNTYPAQVFMGDVGALSLGATLGFVAVLVKQEVMLVVAGGIFVVEATSVIIQRYYYKATKKRMFRMAPIHHHFELLGWPEPKVIVRFWIISIVLALLTLTSLKLR